MINFLLISETLELLVVEYISYILKPWMYFPYSFLVPLLSSLAYVFMQNIHSQLSIGKVFFFSLYCVFMILRSASRKREDLQKS